MTAKKKTASEKKPRARKVKSTPAETSPAAEAKVSSPNEHCGKATVTHTFSDGSVGQLCEVCQATLKEVDGAQRVVRSMGGGVFLPVENE
jgi:hypothetical protein